MEAFSDGVVAIIITIMVLELRVSKRRVMGESQLTRGVDR
jgi:uncharacterized membrane protein